jgi:hypothetical protein
MTKFRTNTHDAPERLPTKPADKPGALPPHRIPVIVDGQRAGHVGYKASAATVKRFGAQRAKLGTHEGRPAWIGISGRGSIKPDAKLAAQLRTAKGSVTKNPTRPETSSRPKRGH